MTSAVLARIAVLPEYAVDLYFAFSAVHNPSHAQYARRICKGATVC